MRIAAADPYRMQPQSEHSILRSRHDDLRRPRAASGIQWTFGDGASLTGGPGVPYRQGAAPAGAVRHVYQARCLPGDRGHDPSVLSSCGSNGYTVEALVQWTISYTASGPVTAGGALPARATGTSVTYPVGEARAFLTSAEGGT